MKVIFCTVNAGSDRTVDGQVAEYVKRLERFCAAEETHLRSVQAFQERVLKERATGAVSVVLLDSRGKLLTSEDFASEIARTRDNGKRTVIFAIGPPDGWSDDALKLADIKLSLGKMTLPHQLARLVLAEQVYRAFTILAGHPYHHGH